jgi:Transposase DNA-binding/Transposase Tn5 dimerisation domain
MKTPRKSRQWAGEEFGSAELGDRRRNDRLVAMAGQAAAAPAGRITDAFPTAADREAAYRFLSNDAVEASAVVAAASRACAARATDEYVVIPVDQCSLSLPSAIDNTSFGRVGNGNTGARGMEAMSAIAVDRSGNTLGVAGQRLFVRTGAPKKGRRKRPLEEKETRYWIDVMSDVDATFASRATRPWFQLDRGGDFKEALQYAAAASSFVTVRASHDRVGEVSESGHLWALVTETEPLGEYSLDVPSRPGRPARRATLRVRASPVYLPLRDCWSKTTGPVILFAVHAAEVSDVPDGQERIEWMLLVNRDVQNLDGAREVIFNYSQRWRIEEIHRVWKTTCTVESSNLRTPDTFAIWAAMLFCVAVRVDRIKRLARTQPNSPADIELSNWEIKTLLLLKDRDGFKRGEVPTIQQAVLWLAELGGYVGKASGGPPGAQTIGRGLDKIALATEAVRKLSQDEK